MPSDIKDWVMDGPPGKRTHQAHSAHHHGSDSDSDNNGLTAAFGTVYDTDFESNSSDDESPAQAEYAYMSA
jgi:hypothetical protein